MSVKLFFQTHGRFPTTDEFRLIRTFRHHQPAILVTEEEDKAPNPFSFVKACREGNLQVVQNLLGTCGLQNLDIGAPLPQLETAKPPPSSSHNSPPIPVHTTSPLCAAAQGDNMDVLTFLISQKASVDARPTQNRTALLFASESGHFNSMNYLISQGATYFTYSDQQIESYFISYTIRQSITRRELSYVLPGDLLPGIVLDYLGLGGHRTRPIERLAPVNLHNKTSFGAKPIPELVISPVPTPHPHSLNLSSSSEQGQIRACTPEAWQLELQTVKEELEHNKQDAGREIDGRRSAYVESRYPHGFNNQGE